MIGLKMSKEITQNPWVVRENEKNLPKGNQCFVGNDRYAGYFYNNHFGPFSLMFELYLQS